MCQVPCFIPAQVRFIEQDAHQFRDGHRGMGVVHLDRNMRRQLAPWCVAAAEPADDVGQRAGHQEEFLDKAQTSTLVCGVVGIKNARQGIGCERFRQCSYEIATAETPEVERFVCRRGPQPERVDILTAVPDNGPVEWNSQENRRVIRHYPQRSRTHLKRAIQVDAHRFRGPYHFPRVGAVEPVIGLFLLPAIVDRLPEHAVFIAQAVSDCRQLKRRHGIEKTGRQPSESAVAQARVGLLIEHSEPIEILLPRAIARQPPQQKIRQVVRKRTAHQVFHGEIVNALGIHLLVGLFRQDPPL